jgi:hypothetical protein
LCCLRKGHAGVRDTRESEERERGDVYPRAVSLGHNALTRNSLHDAAATGRAADDKARDKTPSYLLVRVQTNSVDLDADEDDLLDSDCRASQIQRALFPGHSDRKLDRAVGLRTHTCLCRQRLRCARQLRAGMRSNSAAPRRAAPVSTDLNDVAINFGLNGIRH